MSLVDTNNGGGLSAADIAAVTGNNGYNNGFGGDGAWWLLILLLFGFAGNWGGNGFGANGGVGSEVQRGFDQSAVMSGINGINNSVCNLGTAMNAGFANAETADSARQMANMQQAFATQTAITNGMNTLASQLANCCCENRLATANLTSTVLAENCADRAAISDALRDVMVNQNAGVQRILDTMCQDKIDAKNERIAELQNQLTMANLAASQNAQTSRILADNAAQTVALEQYLNPTPVPAYMVQNPRGCNCGNYFGGCNG